MRSTLFCLALAVACASAANVFCCSPEATNCRACTDQDNIDKEVIQSTYLRVTSRGARSAADMWSDCSLMDTRAHCVRARLGPNQLDIAGNRWQGLQIYSQTAARAAVVGDFTGWEPLDITVTDGADPNVRVALFLASTSDSSVWVDKAYAFTANGGALMRDPWAIGTADEARFAAIKAGHPELVFGGPSPSVVRWPLGWLGPSHSPAFLTPSHVPRAGRVLATTSSDARVDTLIDEIQSPSSWVGDGINGIVLAGDTDWITGPSGTGTSRLSASRTSPTNTLSLRDLVQLMRRDDMLLLAQATLDSDAFVDIEEGSARLVQMFFKLGVDGLWLVDPTDRQWQQVAERVRAAATTAWIIVQGPVADMQKAADLRVNVVSTELQEDMADPAKRSEILAAAFTGRNHRRITYVDGATVSPGTFTLALLGDDMPCFTQRDLQGMSSDALAGFQRLAKKRARNAQLFVQPTTRIYADAQNTATLREAAAAAKLAWSTDSTLAVYLRADAITDRGGEDESIALVNLDPNNSHPVRFYMDRVGALDDEFGQCAHSSTAVPDMPGWRTCDVPPLSFDLFDIRVTKLRPDGPDSPWQFASLSASTDSPSAKSILDNCRSIYGRTSAVCDDRGTMHLITGAKTATTTSSSCSIENDHQWTSDGVRECASPRLGITPFVVAVESPAVQGFLLQTIQADGGGDGVWLTDAASAVQRRWPFEKVRGEDGGRALYRLYVNGPLPNSFAYEDSQGRRLRDAYVRDWSGSVARDYRQWMLPVAPAATVAPAQQRLYEVVPGAVNGFESLELLLRFLCGGYIQQQGANSLLLDAVYATPERDISSAHSLMVMDAMHENEHEDESGIGNRDLQRAVQFCHAQNVPVWTSLDLGWVWSHRDLYTDGTESAERYVTDSVVDLFETYGVDGVWLRIPGSRATGVPALSQLRTTVAALAHLPRARDRFIGEWIGGGPPVGDFPHWQSHFMISPDHVPSLATVGWTEHAWEAERITVLSPGNEMVFAGNTLLTPGMPLIFAGQEWKSALPANSLYTPSTERLTYTISDTDPNAAVLYELRMITSRELRTLAEWRVQHADTRMLRHHVELHDNGQLVTWQLWPPSATERGGMAWLVTMNYDKEAREVGVSELHATAHAVVREWPAISAPLLNKRVGDAAAVTKLRGNDVHNNGTVEPNGAMATISVDPQSFTIWQFNHTLPFVDDGLLKASVDEDSESSSSDPLLPLWIVLGCVGGLIVIGVLIKYCRKGGKSGSGKSVNGGSNDDEDAQESSALLRRGKRRE